MSSSATQQQQRTEVRTFPADQVSARSARRFAVERSLVLGASVDTADTIALLTSELVTNAVIHARTDVQLSVVGREGRIRVCVSDENTRMPTPAVAPIDATSGRGLLLVQSAATAWGIETTNEGKTIWFELDVEAESAH
jgi:anti-sigma regulatory factor (Ser/Thr protein kinase)